MHYRFDEKLCAFLGRGGIDAVAQIHHVLEAWCRRCYYRISVRDRVSTRIRINV